MMMFSALNSTPKLNTQRSGNIKKDELLKSGSAFADKYFQLSNSTGQGFIELCLAIKDGGQITYNQNTQSVNVGSVIIDYVNEKEFEILKDALGQHKAHILELSKNESRLFPKIFTRGFTYLLSRGALVSLGQEVTKEKVINLIEKGLYSYKKKCLQSSINDQAKNNDLKDILASSPELDFIKKASKELHSSNYLDDIEILTKAKNTTSLFSFGNKHYSYFKYLTIINNKIDEEIESIFNEKYPRLNTTEKLFLLAINNKDFYKKINNNDGGTFVEKINNLYSPDKIYPYVKQMLEVWLNANNKTSQYKIFMEKFKEDFYTDFPKITINSPIENTVSFKLGEKYNIKPIGLNIKNLMQNSTNKDIKDGKTRFEENSKTRKDNILNDFNRSNNDSHQILSNLAKGESKYIQHTPLKEMIQNLDQGNMDEKTVIKNKLYLFLIQQEIVNKIARSFTEINLIPFAKLNPNMIFKIDSYGNNKIVVSFKMNGKFKEDVFKVEGKIEINRKNLMNYFSSEDNGITKPIDSIKYEKVLLSSNFINKNSYDNYWSSEQNDNEIFNDSDMNANFDDGWLNKYFTNKPVKTSTSADNNANKLAKKVYFTDEPVKSSTKSNNVINLNNIFEVNKYTADIKDKFYFILFAIHNLGFKAFTHSDKKDNQFVLNQEEIHKFFTQELNKAYKNNQTLIDKTMMKLNQALDDKHFSQISLEEYDGVNLRFNFDKNMSYLVEFNSKDNVKSFLDILPFLDRAFIISSISFLSQIESNTFISDSKKEEGSFDSRRRALEVDFIRATQSTHNIFIDEGYVALIDHIQNIDKNSDNIDTNKLNLFLIKQDIFNLVIMPVFNVFNNIKNSVAIPINKFNFNVYFKIISKEDNNIKIDFNFNGKYKDLFIDINGELGINKTNLMNYFSSQDDGVITPIDSVTYKNINLSDALKKGDFNYEYFLNDTISNDDDNKKFAESECKKLLDNYFN